MISHTLRGGWTDDPHPLPAGALRTLHATLDLASVQTPGVPSSELVVPASALPAATFDALAAIVGASNIKVDRESRLGRTGGLSYLDLIRRRAGVEVAVPDAVVLPGSPEEAAAVVEACGRLAVAVVPFGGGTSVVGGVAALRGDKPAVVAVDLMRLDQLVSVDPVSRLAVLQAGVRGPDAESLLAAQGFTLGHFPQSFERATIGGFAATRSAGQASSGYGRFDDMVVALRVATPRGEWRLGAGARFGGGAGLAGVGGGE